MVHIANADAPVHAAAYAGTQILDEAGFTEKPPVVRLRRRGPVSAGDFQGFACGAGRPRRTYRSRIDLHYLAPH